MYDPNDFEQFYAQRILNASAVDVERLITEMFNRIPGWKAKTTPPSNDFGADIIAQSPIGIYAIQVKHWKGKVGNDAVQAVLGAMPVWKAKYAIVITTGPGFTQSAKIQAQHAKVKLWGKRELAILYKASLGQSDLLSQLSLEYSVAPSFVLLAKRYWQLSKPVLSVMKKVPVHLWILLVIIMIFIFNRH
ncbi:restriction endonuclease [Allomeiothermus silvanus DSM 9946]|uniref:Restriction endonuclease n=2 Tax=Allomeiothermus silvanus TaxID=52022 RepID=D7BFR7_ALLS1|nr:restriction endonuclease [Allomeiothermus silvanus DSM 9946]